LELSKEGQNREGWEVKPRRVREDPVFARKKGTRMSSQTIGRESGPLSGLAKKKGVEEGGEMGAKS